MTDAVHTPGPWACPKDEDGQIAIVAESGYLVTFAFPNGDGAIEANARRIVACVNALEGISTADIEAGVIAELVEALKPFAAIQYSHNIADGPMILRSEWFDAARNALAKIGGAS